MAETKGWYTNEKGDVCYDGHCFGLVTNPETGVFDIEVDEQCDIDEVSQAERAFMRAAMDGRSVTMKKRKRGGDRGASR